MSPPLPYYQITHRCGDGVYTAEARTDAPLDWRQLVEEFWGCQYDDVVRIWKIVPPSSAEVRGYVEDVTRNMALALSQDSYLLSKEPGREVIDFLKSQNEGWFEPVTEQDAWARHHFGKTGVA